MNATKKSPDGNRGGKAGKQNLKKYNTVKIEFNENRPPCNLEAESRLIENLIFRPEKVDLAADIVRSEDFYSRLRGTVYQRIIEYNQAERVWNLTTLTASFQDDPSFQKYQDFFDDLLPLTGELAVHNSRLIKDCSNARKLIAATYKAHSDLYSGTGIDEVRETLSRILQEVSP